MGKKILILSGSPRKGANSETLCAQFTKGGSEAGHTVELIRLQEKKLNFCTACYACKKAGVCVQQDDMAEILGKMGAADVIVLSTPVYFYQMAAQMKTLIDRAMDAAEDKPALERTMDGLKGLTDCVPGAKVKGRIYGANAWQRGEIEGNPAYFRMGS